MGANDMVQQWRRTVNDLIPSLHGHLISALATVSVAVASAAHCHSGKLAAMMPGPANLASRRRRIERLWANDKLDAAAAMDELATSLLTAWSGRRLILILDETPKG